MKKAIYILSMTTITFCYLANNAILCSNETEDNFSGNIEALASGENPDGVFRHPCAGKISSNENYGKIYTQRYCGDCKEHSITREWGESNCIEN